jgi:hypothetical protein
VSGPLKRDTLQILRKLVDIYKTITNGGGKTYTNKNKKYPAKKITTL